MLYDIEILTAMKGTVKIKGPRWLQNNDYAQMFNQLEDSIYEVYKYKY